MKIYKHIPTGIIGKTNGKDYFLHFERGNEEVVVKESISMEFVENSMDWEDITPLATQQGKIPTPWFKTEEIETWIGGSLTDEVQNGGRGKLIVLHQCGEDKGALIGQLETLIHGLKEGFDEFAN